MKRLLCVFAALAALAACGPVQPQIQGIPDVSQYRSIRLVSALPGQLDLISGPRESVDIAWDLNDRILDDMSEVLRGSYAVTRQTVEMSADKRLKSGSNRYRGIAVPGAADLVLVVEPRVGFDGEQTFGFDGMRISYSERLGTRAAVLYQITMLDGRTLKPVAASHAVIPPVGIARDLYARKIGFFSYPVSEVDLGWRGERFSDLPPLRREAMKKALEALVDQSVFSTMYRLGFGAPAKAGVYASDNIGPSPATLSGSRVETSGLMKDAKFYIDAVDGLATFPTPAKYTGTVTVSPGRHDVRIYGEQSFSYDGVGTVTAVLEPGKRYVARGTPLMDGDPQVWIEEVGTGTISSDKGRVKVKTYVKTILVPMW